MKITKVEPILCDGAWGHGFSLKSQRNRRITAMGISDHRGLISGLVACINDLGLTLIGPDPRPVEKLYADMYQLARQPSAVSRSSNRRDATTPLGIKAKALGVPVYELFGASP